MRKIREIGTVVSFTVVWKINGNHNFFSVTRANSQNGTVPRSCTTEDSFFFTLENLGNHSTMVDNGSPSESLPCLVANMYLQICEWWVPEIFHQSWCLRLLPLLGEVGAAKEPAEPLTHLKGRQQVLKISLSWIVSQQNTLYLTFHSIFGKDSSCF